MPNLKDSTYHRQDNSEEEGDDVPLEELDSSDLESENEDDIAGSLKQRLTINNEAAITQIISEFKLKPLPWIEIMSVTTSLPITIKDPDDDLSRELAFYQQALEGAKEGRAKVLEAKVPFSRPDDYFAEMMKSDEHMEKIRQKLLDESASIKASEDSRRQRELKKFGKKVQIEKIQERQKQKAEALEKIKMLKRKRNGAEDIISDDFDIELSDNDENTRPSRKVHGRSVTNKGKFNPKRARKDAKYGFGGKKKHMKSNTAESSGDLSGFSTKKNKTPMKGFKSKPGRVSRPGKAKRQNRK